MAFPSVIDIDSLVGNISDDSPTGSDIREDRSPTSDYYSIKDARNSARAAERSALFDDSDVDLLAPWREVEKVANKVLSGVSKDLEVASWYTEALIRLYGFPGLRDGLQLIERLVSEHWEGLYPEPDEDGLETKVAPVSGLNGDGAEGTLMMPIRNAPITPETDYGAFSFFQYQQARDADRLPDEDAKAARVETLGYGMDLLNQNFEQTSDAWACDLVDTLDEAIASFKATNEKLREYCGHDAPPSSNVSGILDEVLRTTRFIYKPQLESANEQQEEQDAQVESVDGAEAVVDSAISAAQARPVTVASGEISSREDALKMLEAAAKYFRRFEPHTPLAPGLERLITWGRMTVSELMVELLPDDQSRAMYSQLTGVKLDGSDTQRYVAPPVSPSPSAASASPSTGEGTEPASSAPAEDGWGEKKETAQEPAW
ncbi:type VI secretion system protein TssA [Microbulbifer sp.]|uniref:type VI secretion system protein TssA n=1 Tax=Microbulbifer sp. TaxID=1908541 RepID=UPI002586DF22|nr:type VI secretion system protein TssA [Microbulbifer sp.]